MVVSGIDSGGQAHVLNQAAFLTINELKIKLEKAELENKHLSSGMNDLRSQLDSERKRATQLSGLLKEMVRFCCYLFFA